MAWDFLAAPEAAWRAVGLGDPTRCCSCPGVEKWLSQDREQCPHCSALGHSWWDNTQFWRNSHLPTLTGALQPHGNLPPACDYPWQLFVPMPPAGDGLDATVVWLGKNHPMFSHTGIGFVGNLHLDKSTSKNIVFAPILDDGFVPKHLRGQSRRTQSVKMLRNAHRLRVSWQTSYLI